MPDQNNVNVGPAESFPVDEFRILTIGRREIGILRRGDGRVQAVRNWCPHKGAPMCKFKPTGTMIPGPPGTLEWGHEGEILRCPWHGFEFNIDTGLRLYTESRMRLRIYPARVENGDIIVDMGPQTSKEAAT